MSGGGSGGRASGTDRSFSQRTPTSNAGERRVSSSSRRDDEYEYERSRYRERSPMGRREDEDRARGGGSGFANRGDERPVLVSPVSVGGPANRTTDERFDATYYKSRVARLEEKLAKEHGKVKATVKYYEEQFTTQAKKLTDAHEEEKKQLADECSRLKSQVEWLKQTQEALKSERAARETLEAELKALREEDATKKSDESKGESDEQRRAEIKRLEESLEEARQKAETAETALREHKAEAERAKSAVKPVESDPAEVRLLQKQLDEEKAKSRDVERELKETAERVRADTATHDSVKEKLAAAETELVKTRQELALVKESEKETVAVRARLEVAEKLVYQLKSKAQRVDELERFYADSHKDKESLRHAYSQIQEMTDKLLQVTSEKEVLVRHSLQQAQLEASLEKTQQELSRLQNQAHTAAVDKSNSEMNFKYIIDDISRALREHAISTTRWEARMASEIKEASEEHSEIRRQTLNLVSTAEADAQRVLRDSIDAVNEARRAIQDNHRRNEDIIEDVLRQERHRLADETKTMKSQLIDAERRAAHANEQIDQLSEQLRTMRVDLHLAKDAHAALLATTSTTPSLVDTARDYASEGVHSPANERANEKVDAMKKQLRLAQFQLLVMKAVRKFNVEPGKAEIERKLEQVERERAELLSGRRAAAMYANAEASEMQEELTWCRTRIARLEAEVQEGRLSQQRENELKSALKKARHDVETTEEALRQLKKQQLSSFEGVTDDLESYMKIKLNEMREEVVWATAKKEEATTAASKVEDELIIVRTERDNAISDLRMSREELQSAREAISEMSSSRSELLSANREEIRARENELHSVRKELATVRAQKDNTLTAIEELKSALLDTQNRLSEAEERRAQMESQLFQKSKSSHDNVKLETEVAVLTTERDQMQTHLEEVLIERDAREEELKRLIARLSESEEKTTSTVAQSRAEVFMANKTISTLRTELKDVEDALESTKKQLERSNVEKRIANETLEETREDLGECEVELKLAIKNGEDKEKQRQQAVDLMRDAQDALEETRKELEKTEAELVNLVEVVEQGEEEHQRTKVKLMQTSQDLESTRARLETIVRAADEADAERAVASEQLAETRAELSDVQAESELRESQLLELKIRCDRVEDELTQTTNELKLTEAYLEKAGAAIEKHRAERDGLQRALESANDNLSARESQLQAMSAQLAELYEEVEEYRMEDDEIDEELTQTRQNLDAVIDKFKALREVHEAALENLQNEIAERVRDQRKHEKAMEASKIEYEKHMRMLKKAVESKSDMGALASELFSLLTDLQMAEEDARIAGKETELRTAAQYSDSIVPPANKEAFEALLRIKTGLDDIKSRLSELSTTGAAESDASTEALRSNLKIRVLVFETFINLISQHSRVGAYKGRVLGTARRTGLAADVELDAPSEDGSDPRVERARAVAGVPPASRRKRTGLALSVFGNKIEI
jgi:chromosome segregation ATPase